MLYFFIQIRFLQDLKVAHIPPEDVVFFFCWANYFWGSCKLRPMESDGR